MVMKLSNKRWGLLGGGLLAALLMSGCGSGGNTTTDPGRTEQPGNNDAPTPSGEAGSVSLSLDALTEGASYRLVLSVPQAQDLYQLAGTLVYDPQRYRIERVEAGGGLGTPQDSYFMDAECTAGRRGFAYTRRFAGAGVGGPASLVHFIVTPLGQTHFALADFSLNTAEAPLKVRDSHKHEFRVSIMRGTVQR
jgi:hypothetical protein